MRSSKNCEMQCANNDRFKANYSVDYALFGIIIDNNCWNLFLDIYTLDSLSDNTSLTDDKDGSQLYLTLEKVLLDPIFILK